MNMAEPLRSRVIMVAGAVWFAAGVAAVVWAGGAGSPWWWAIAVGCAWLVPFFAVIVVAVVAGMAVFAWRGFFLELTPSGVYWRRPLLRRSVPWEALAPGGPPRPQLTADLLHLVVARPELVVERGWSLGSGPRHRPVVPLDLTVHPWFLADAIRWYAEHPADRAGIGTEAGHQRLVAALAAAEPATSGRCAGPVLSRDE